MSVPKLVFRAKPLKLPVRKPAVKGKVKEVKEVKEVEVKRWSFYPAML